MAIGRHRIVLPGTHSKWVTVEDGRITAIRTYLTGELFALLRDHSILARAATDGEVDAADDQAGFVDGLDRARSGGLIGALFTARSAQLLEGRSHGWALGYLSGLLIGGEIVEALAGAPLPDRIMLIGDPRLAARYRIALAAHAVAVDPIDGDEAVLAGLDLLETSR